MNKILVNFEEVARGRIIDSMTHHHAVLLTVELPLIFELDTPAHFVYREPQVGIDLVRALIQTAYRRPAEQASEQLIMVATEFITEEAQHALLKVVEEPPISTKFVFVLPEGYALLPTLESRFERRVGKGAIFDSSEFRLFQGATHAARLAAIEESVKKKDQLWQTAIKRGLLTYLKTEGATLAIEKKRELEYVSRLLLTRGASNKLLLEHLALTL